MLAAVRTHSYTIALPTFPPLSPRFKHMERTLYISVYAALSAVPSAARIFKSLI